VQWVGEELKAEEKECDWGGAPTTQDFKEKSGRGWNYVLKGKKKKGGGKPG